MDIATVRSHFPSLKQEQVFLDNAGGSQALGTVIESITSYLTEINVQLGASYDVSQSATSRFDHAFEAAARFINAKTEEICLGPSTTQLLHNLSTALVFRPGDELVLSTLNHEANIAPWVRIATSLGLEIKWWTSPDPRNPQADLDTLAPLLSDKTRLVGLSHVSNILGTIVDVKAISRLVHQYPRALVCVDGVAYAPHRKVDVRDLEVDIYAFSWYKVYGPHIAQLFVSSNVLDQVNSLGHFFKDANTLDLKLDMSSSSYELVQSIPQIVQYLDPSGSITWDQIAAHEESLQRILLDYLHSDNRITVYGEPSASQGLRVPVISFTVNGFKSQDVVTKLEATSPFGIRNGHLYSYRLLKDVMGLDDVEDGVVRVSMVHYNTEKEIFDLVEALKRVLG